MEENVQNEIDTLKNLVRRWYDFYLDCANGHKYDQVHVEEFDEVVNEQLMPYLTRLEMCEHLTHEEHRDFCNWLFKKHTELSEAIAKVKPKQEEDPIITLLKNLNLTDGQKKAVAEYLKAEKGCNGNCGKCAG